MSVQSLVEAAQQPAIDVTGLWDTYKGMVSRSRAEKEMIARELAAAGDGALIDVFGMFTFPEAYGPDRYPLVGMAPISASVIQFIHERYGVRTGFRLPYTDKLALTVAKPPQLELGWRPDEPTHEHFVRLDRANDGFTGIVNVPFVPKAIAPRFWSAKRLLGKCWIMFDTPSWSDKRVLPVDPYLLERLDERRFRVLAHWDLTAKERQLMALIR